MWKNFIAYVANEVDENSQIQKLISTKNEKHAKNDFLVVAFLMLGLTSYILSLACFIFLTFNKAISLKVKSIWI